jgi:hypothetical protein
MLGVHVTRAVLAEGRDPAAAEALFREGRAAAQKGNWDVACPKLRESERLDPAAGTLLNLADCEEHRGKVATAWQLFRQVAESLPESDERVPLAKRRAADLEKRLPHLTVRLAGVAPIGVKVVRNDVELSEASLGAALPVDPGSYQIVVTAPGRQLTKATVVVTEGAASAIEVRAGAEVVETNVDRTPRSSPRTAGWIAVGVGAAGLGVGVVAGVLTLERKSTVDDNCMPDKRCNPVGYDAAQSGKTLGVVTTAGLLVGAVGVGVGAYLLLRGDDARGPSVTARVSPDGATVAFRTNW